MASPSSPFSCAPFSTAPGTVQANYTTPGTTSAYEGVVSCPLPGGGLDIELLGVGAEATEVELLVPAGDQAGLYHASLPSQQSSFVIDPAEVVAPNETFLVSLSNPTAANTSSLVASFVARHDDRACLAAEGAKSGAGRRHGGPGGVLVGAMGVVVVLIGFLG